MNSEEDQYQRIGRMEKTNDEKRVGEDDQWKRRWIVIREKTNSEKGEDEQWKGGRWIVKREKMFGRVWVRVEREGKRRKSVKIYVVWMQEKWVKDEWSVDDTIDVIEM